MGEHINKLRNDAILGIEAYLEGKIHS